MSVSFAESLTPSIGAPERLFDFVELPADGPSGPTYTVARDGLKFVVVEPVSDAPPQTVRVVQNWFQEFRDREQD